MTANSFNDKTIQVQDITGQTYEITWAHLLHTAKRCIREQFASDHAPLTSLQAARDLVQVLIGAREHEFFMALWLDTRHRVIVAYNHQSGIPSRHRSILPLPASCALHLSSSKSVFLIT